MAEWLSIHEGRPLEGPRQGLHATLRHLRKHLVLRPVEKLGIGPTAADLYDDNELAWARVCLALMELGMDAPRLRHVRQSLMDAGKRSGEPAFRQVRQSLVELGMDAPRLERVRQSLVDEDEHRGGGFPEAVQAVRRFDCRWLAIVVERTPGLETTFYARLASGRPDAGEGEKDDDEARKRREARWRDAPTGAAVVEATIVLPLHDLLAGLLPALAAAPASQPAAADNG